MTDELVAYPNRIRKMADTHLNAVERRTQQAGTALGGSTEHAASAFGPPSFWGADDGALWTSLVEDFECLLEQSQNRLSLAQVGLHRLAQEYEAIDRKSAADIDNVCPDRKLGVSCEFFRR